MNTMLKLIYPFFICSSLLFSQDQLEDQFKYAKQLYDQENYFDAVTELKRLIFFDEKKEFSYEANMLAGRAYKAGAKLNDAIYHFTQAEINSQTAGEYYNAGIEIVRATILRRTTARTLMILKNLEEDKRFNDKINELNYWRGWA